MAYFGTSPPFGGLPVGVMLPAITPTFTCGAIHPAPLVWCSVSAALPHGKKNQLTYRQLIQVSLTGWCTHYPTPAMPYGTPLPYPEKRDGRFAPPFSPPARRKACLAQNFINYKF